MTAGNNHSERLSSLVAWNSFLIVRWWFCIYMQCLFLHYSPFSVMVKLKTFSLLHVTTVLKFLF